VVRFDDLQRRQTSPPSDGVIAAFAALRHGVVSLAELVELGMTPRAAQRRAATGRLHRIHLAVYAVAPRALLSADGLRRAAVLACGQDAVLSHRSAGAAWGLCRDGQRWDVTLPRAGRVPPSEIAPHPTRRLSLDEVQTLRAVRITTVHRTLVDLASVLDPDRLERALNEAEVLRLLDVAAVLRAADRAPGRKGLGVLRAMLAAPATGRTRSELEERFLALCRRGGLPVPRLNAMVVIGRRTVEVDALWADERVVVELDGARFHQTRRGFEMDRRRDAALVAAGFVVVRLTWRRVTTEARDVRDELQRVLVLRGGQV
jgi:very-short-patch-repair endonuclease